MKAISMTITGLLILLSMGSQGIIAQSFRPSVPVEHYRWKSVQIVGGGFVDGIVFHPKEKDVRYCRTDMGGAYRWDKEAQQWVSMLDWITYDDNNLVGVESIAVDPNDPQTVYLSCGTYTRSTNGAVLCSNDGGRTFTRTDMPFTMGGNENGRGNGERMMVDPLNSDIIYLGTRLDGLWRSADRGRSWQQVCSFPNVAEVIPEGGNPWMQDRGCGINLVLFDPSGGTAGKGCSTLYIGVSLKDRDNFFVSHDYGESWQPLAGQPVQYRPTQAVLSEDGYLYITYGSNPGPMRMNNGAVWKYDPRSEKWQDISPVKADPDKGAAFGYAAVSVDRQNPKHLIVSTFNRPVAGSYAEDDIYRTTDGGKTWKPVFAGGARFDYGKAPYVEFTPLHWMFDIEIDPFDPDHALFTTGYGGWETFNLGNMDKKEPTQWQVMSTGIEETVPLELYSPKQGAQLISAIGDYGGFTHLDLDRPVPSGSHADPYYSNTTGITGAEDQPDLVVRVGTVSHHHPEGKPLAYSMDGGKSWLEPVSLPQEKAQNGHVAVSSDGRTWIWTPDRMPVYYTNDRGVTWSTAEGIPENLRVIADRVNPKRFYALDLSAAVLYESMDGGVSFRSHPLPFAPFDSKARNARGDRRGGQDRVYATPGKEGNLWIAVFDGLYHGLSGEAFVPQDKVRRIYAFGFGKAAPGSDYPSLYLAGIVNGVSGFFRSDDAARSWVRINDDDHQYGLVLQISGDPKRYGRVYVGSHGRGIVYADPY